MSESSWSPGRPLRVALLGCGVVGTEVARLLTSDSEELAQRVGAPLELVGIAVRRMGRERDLDVPAEQHREERHDDDADADKHCRRGPPLDEFALQTHEEPFRDDQEVG